MKRRALFLRQSPREARSSFKRLGVPVTVLGATNEFTAFTPPPGFTIEALTETLWGRLYEVTADDDGLRVQWHVIHHPGDLVEELSLTMEFGTKFRSTEASELFLGIAGPLEEREDDVRALIAEPVRRRDELLRRGELLKRLGLPAIELPLEAATGSPAQRAPATRSPKTTPLVARQNGRMIHVPKRADLLREALDLHRIDAELVESNALWSSFIPRDPAFRVDEFIETVAMRCDALDVRWDDDFGLQLDLHQVGTGSGERVQVRLGQPFREGPTERVFFSGLGARARVRARVVRVRDALQEPVEARDAWLRAGGFEKTLGLPTAQLEPLPQLRLERGVGRLRSGSVLVVEP